MRRQLQKTGTAFAVLLAVCLGLSLAQAQVHQVTFVVNTATVPDTLVPTSDVRITGSGAALTDWGAGIAMTNIGGDYWSTTVGLNEGDTVNFKLKITAGGWEQDLIDPYGLNNNNRVYIVDTHNDTTLPMQFWNNGPKQAQYFRPWTAQPDSFLNVYFRVDMQGIIQSGSFSWNDAVDGDSVGVRGDGKGGDMAWAPTFYLTRESPPTNSAGAFFVPANSFFSGRVRFLKSQVNPGDVIQYKYLIGADWGRDELQSQPNRTFPIPQGLKDTTIQYVYFNNQRPNQRANTDTCIVTYRTNMQAAIQSGGYSIGDTVVVRSGYFGTTTQSAREKRMLRQGLSTVYGVTDTVVSSIANTLDYQYYVIKNGVSTRENYYNFNYSGPTPSEAEKRVVIVPSNSFAIYDTATSIVSERRQPDFANSRVLNHDVNVRWEVDVRPAIYQVLAGDTLSDVQGSFNVENADSVLAWGVWMNGPAVGGWSNTGTTDWDFGLMNNLDKKLYDDGTHGDLVAGDSIFTRMVLASPDSVINGGTKNVVGQVFKFGIRGGDNEGGKGGFGNNHLANINDADTVYTIHSQFGSINPAYYNAWDYDCGCPAVGLGVNDGKALPKVFSLSQNYPNPFNPSTKIEYTLPQTAYVVLKVYNVIGQEVATLINTRQSAGSYTANFNPSKLTSGVYFYKLTAGTFVSTKKMLLMK